MTQSCSYQPTQKEEGQQKPGGHGRGYRLSGGVGGQDSIHNIGVDPQLRIMEKLGDITAAARSEKLLFPLCEDGMEICLLYHTKEECIRSYTRSHAPLQGHSAEDMIRYIGIFRVDFNPLRKRNFDGGGNRGLYGGQCNRNGGNGNGQNPDGKAHGSGTGFGVGRVGHVGGGRQDGNNSRGRGAHGGSGKNTKPPHQDVQRLWSGIQNCRYGGRLA